MSPNECLGASKFMNELKSILDQIAQTQQTEIVKSAEIITSTIKAGGIVYTFGTGHSHLLALEGHHRAGGLAPVCPILSSSLMLHESSLTASRLERTVGIAPILLARYQPTQKDVLIIFSNSGVNAVPVEMALSAKKIEMKVIAIVSKEYSSQAPLSPLGVRLMEIADVTIDNFGPPGDALVEMDNINLKVGPSSTITGAFILNAIFTEVAFRLHSEGFSPPVYISANMPGAAEHNRHLRANYLARIPHL